MQNSRTAWQDEAERPLPEPEKAPKGTFLNAHLISPYFRIENTKADMSAWRVPYRSSKLMKLRQQLAEVKARWGNVTQSGMLTRPGAGLPVAGPLPLPQCVAKSSLACPNRHDVPRDFDMPTEAVIVRYSWYFRAGFARQEPDLTPVFDCIGLMAVKEAV